MKLVLLLLVVGIIFYCSEKNVFKKLKQTGGDDGNQVAVIGALTAACALIAGVVYYLTTQKCTCKHGTAQTDTDKCSGDDKENCTDCDDGFTLNDTKCNKDDSKKGCDAITCPPEKNLKKKPGKPTCAATTCTVTECCDCTSKDYKIDNTKQKCEKDQDKYKCNSQKCEKSTDADAMSKSECEANCQGWKCDSSSKQCKKGPNGKYATKSDCEAKESTCHNELYKIETITGTYAGTYPTSSDHYHPSIPARFQKKLAAAVVDRNATDGTGQCGTYWSSGTGVSTQKCAICCKKNLAKGTDPSTPDYPIWCKQNKAFSDKSDWKNCT